MSEAFTVAPEVVYSPTVIASEEPPWFVTKMSHRTRLWALPTAL